MRGFFFQSQYGGPFSTVTETLEYRDCQDGSGKYIVRTATLTNVDFDPANYRKMAVKEPDLVPTSDATAAYFEAKSVTVLLDHSIWLFSDIFHRLIERNKGLGTYLGIQLPIYGADLSGSLFKASTPGVNLSTLRYENLLEDIIRDAQPPQNMYDGVSDPMLYFGSFYLLAVRPSHSFFRDVWDSIWSSLGGFYCVVFSLHFVLCRT